MAIGFDITEKAKAWFEVIWNQGEVDRIDEFVTEGSIAHLASGPCSARDVFKSIHATFRTAFPDLKITIEDTVTSGDNVVVRWRFDGNHLAQDVGTPIGKAAHAGGMTWMKFDGETISEGWDCWIYDGMFEDLFRNLTSSPAAIS
jgi:steroid delta-isomerase-like uncharacterized protein